MQVQVDNLWGTPSGIHMRVTVWADDRKWRHRFDQTVLWAEVPDDAIGAMVAHWMDTQPEEDHQQSALF
jgi:hypothetical protein